MPIKNPKDLLVAATMYPAAIEAALPEGAPKISATLLDIAGKVPKLPDLPMEAPDLPAPPALPEAPKGPGEVLARAFKGPEVEVTRTTKREIIPSPVVGVLPEVITRRGM